MGIGSCCLGGPVRFMKSPAAAEYMKQLGFSEGYELLYAIAFKFCGSNFLIRCIVDILHIRRKLFLILINDIFTGVPDLMYHTDLSG